MINKNIFYKLIPFLIIFLFILFPFIFNKLSIGGDDSGLYYFFPNEYLTNFASKIISDNQAGTLGMYFSQLYIAIFSTSISLLKYLLSIFSLEEIIQPLLLSLNSFIGIIFLTKFFKIIFPKGNYYLFLPISLLFPFSTLNYFTLWNHKLFSIYLLSFIPLLLYFFTKYILDKKIVYIYSLIVISFFYTHTFYSIPWIVGTLIVLFPYLIYLFSLDSRKFLYGFSTLFTLLFLLNIYWIFHFVYAPLSSSNPTDVISQVSSSETMNSNVQNITLVSQNNSLIYPLLGLFHKSIQVDFGLKTYDTFKKYYENNILLNFTFVSLISISYIIIKTRKSKKIYLTALSSWLISLYLFTVNIGDWGLPLFLKLNNTIPGFAMFRNMYDKFGIPLSLSFSLLFGISVSIVFNNLSKSLYKYILIIFSVFLVTINVYPFASGDIFRIQYGNTTKIYNQLSNIEEQINTVLSGFNNIEIENKILWWPLNTSNYVIIEDKYINNQMYAGVSPLSLLSPHQDLTGLLSFNKVQSNKIRRYINNKEHEKLGQLFQTLNVNYIAVYDFNDKNIQNSYLFTINTPGDFYDLQMNQQLLDEFLGEKIRKVDDYYTIYKINDKFISNKIFLSTSYDFDSSSSAQISYRKIDSHLYDIKIENLTENTKLIFLDPYHDKWELYKGDQVNEIYASGKHDFVFDYANGWEIHPSDLGQNFNLTLYFQPYKYYWPLILVSILTFLTVIIFLIFLIYKDKYGIIKNNK